MSVKSKQAGKSTEAAGELSEAKTASRCQRDAADERAERDLRVGRKSARMWVEASF